MSDQNQGVGDVEDPQISDQDQGDQTLPKEEGSEKKIPLTQYKKALDDMQAARKELAKLKEQVEEIEATKLRETNDFKSLYEQAKEKLQAAKGENDKLKSAFIQTQKFNAVKNAALKAGLRNEEDLDLLDLSGVEVDMIQGTNGVRFEPRGVDEFISGLKESREHWFKPTDPPKTNPAVPGGARQSATGKITPQDVAMKEREWKSGKIKYQEYVDYHTQYVKQLQSKSA